MHGKDIYTERIEEISGLLFIRTVHKFDRHACIQIDPGSMYSQYSRMEKESECFASTHLDLRVRLSVAPVLDSEITR